MRTTLTSGAEIEHRPIQDLKAKDKDAVSQSVKMAVQLNDDGEFDRSQGMVLTGAMGLAARNAVIARVITGWPYGPVPYYEAGEVHGAELIDEIPLDDFNELEELVAPYLAKLRQKPNPKAQAAATTTSSSGPSRGSGRPSPAG